MSDPAPAAELILEGEPACIACGSPRHRGSPRYYEVPLCRRCWLSNIVRRYAAGMIDFLLIGSLLIRFVPLICSIPLPFTTWNLHPIALAFVLCRDLAAGVSPGKLITGLVTVDRVSQKRVTRWQAFKRNAMWLIPYVAFVDVILVFHGPRSGDEWARAMVIRRRDLGKDWRPQPRRKPGRYCPDCQYDLTGNVSGVCPECGREVPPWVRDHLSAAAKSEAANLKQ